MDATGAAASASSGGVGLGGSAPPAVGVEVPSVPESPPKGALVTVVDSQDVDITTLPTPEKMMEQDSQSFRETPATQLDSEEEREKILRAKTLELGQEEEDESYQDVPQEVIPPSQPRPPSPIDENHKEPEIKEPEIKEPEVKEPEAPPEHHMLDEYAKKVLTRAEQDALRWGGDGDVEKAEKKKGGGKGRGRGKGKGRGKGRGRGKSDGKGKGKKNPKPKTRASKAFGKYVGDTKQSLNTKFEEASKDDDWSLAKDGKRETETSTKTKPLKRPAAAKATVSKAKTKASDKPDALDVSGSGGEDEKPKKRAKSSGDEKGSAAPSGKKRGNPGVAIPTFTHCTIVPYWSRNAVALKMPCKDDGASSSGLTQARGVKLCFSLACLGRFAVIQFEKANLFQV